MDIHSNHGATSEGILENVWAKIMSSDRADGRKGDAAECSNSWEELPNLDGREGSMEILQRLPSLGRWISMGADFWEEVLEGIILPNTSNTEYSGSNNNLEIGSANETHNKVGDAVRIEKGPKAYLNFPLEMVANALACDHKAVTHLACTCIGNKEKLINSRKRASREREAFDDIMNEQPATKKLECMVENELGAFVFHDLGSDYLDSLLSSF
ncbi:hypothetical protein JHK82_041692 [Glycine max]|nr:hypothetical protein JHK85_042362 [Glycine max]KAG5104722.1 hypothetical protein JHK82_041692 [Glycine max]